MTTATSTSLTAAPTPRRSRCRRGRPSSERGARPVELLRLLELPPAALGPPASTAFPDARAAQASSRACARATRTIRCCVQVWPLAAERAASTASRPIPCASKAWPRRAHPKIPGARAADRERRLPVALPLLLPPRVSVPIAARGARRTGRPRSRELRDAPDVTRSDLERRRSAVALEPAARASSSRASPTRRVTTLRIHTRFPIAMPERVDDGLLRLLRGTRLQTVVVVHANHANELDAGVERALAALKPRAHGAAESVRAAAGVNDDVDDARALERASVRLRRSALLPAPARPRRRRRALRRRRAPRPKRWSRRCAAVCRAISCRGSSARRPGS